MAAALLVAVRPVWVPVENKTLGCLVRVTEGHSSVHIELEVSFLTGSRSRRYVSTFSLKCIFSLNLVLNNLLHVIQSAIRYCYIIII